MEEQVQAASVRMAEAAWQRVVELHRVECSKRADTAKASLLQPDDAVLRWHAHNKSEFLAAWRHASAMLDSESIRDEYAAYLSSPSSDIVRRALEALGVDVSALLALSRSDDALRGFREQHTGVEGVLVACLGHYLPRPRSQSIKLLNALYDGHDWGVSSPLTPMLTSTGERFVVDVWTTHSVPRDGGGSSGGAGPSGEASSEAGASGAGIPEAFRFLVSAPPFDPAGSASAASVESGREAMRRGVPETLSTMHRPAALAEEDVWVPAVQNTGSGEAPAGASAMISTTSTSAGAHAHEPQGGHHPESTLVDGKRYIRVKATRVRLSLAPFPRCGFYDWRLVVVGGDGSVRPATCMQPLTAQEVAAAVASGALPAAALHAGAQGSASPRLGLPAAVEAPPSRAFEVPTALPVTSLAQGRCIVHRAGLADEHFHEAVVDLEGMTFTEGGEIVSHGTFASLAAGLRTLRGQGVTSIIVVGAMERDNGWGEREPEASAANTPAQVQQQGGGARDGRADVDAVFQPQMPLNSLAGFLWPGTTAPTAGDRTSDSGSEFGFIELGGEVGGAVGASSLLGAHGLMPGGRAVTFGTPIPAFQVAGGGGAGGEGPDSGLPGDALPAGARPYAMRPDANPHAVVDRITPNRMLGGALGFVHLVREASSLGMRVLVQAESSTSASRPHRKYRNLYCHTLDTRGQASVHAGTDSCENQWEDQQLLNYRKLETWELLVSEAKTLAQNLSVGGLYLPDAQSFPFIMALDTGELWRRDVDGESHYSSREILEGAVVISNAEVGYWSSRAASSYANPLLVKLARAMWQVDPTFAIVGESHWGRAGALSRSGILPHGLDLVTAVSSTLGRYVDKMGSVRSLTLPGDVGPVHLLRALLGGEEDGLVPPQTAPHARELLDAGHFPHPLRSLRPSPAGPLPRGAGRFQLRSMCSTRLPYPALLFGRSAWTAVDLMYALPGIPCTFGEETGGRAYRVDLAGTYAPNASYLEQEKKKRDKRLQAEKHNKKQWERERTGALSAGQSYRSMSRLSGAGPAPLVSRPSMLHLALMGSGGPGGADVWGGDSLDAHLGAGGVVPAFAPPTTHGEQGSALHRTGFSHMNLQELGAVAAGIATGTGAGRQVHGMQRAAVPSPLGVLPPTGPATTRSIGSVTGSAVSSSPALNMLLGGGMEGASEGGFGGVAPWGSTPAHAQHTVPLFGHFGNADGSGSVFGPSSVRLGHAPLDHAEAPGGYRATVLGGDAEDEGEGDDVFGQFGGVGPSSFGFSIAGRASAVGTQPPPRGRGASLSRPPPPLLPTAGAPLHVATTQEAPTLATVEHTVQAGAGGEVPKVESWVPQGGLRTFSEHGGGWHAKKDSSALSNMKLAEDRLRYEVGPEYGFDLAKIAGHYEHRRDIRSRYRVLRDGDMRVLVARHRFGEHGHVFSFSRTLPGGVAVVALNFNGHPSTFAVDTSPLAAHFGATTTADASASVHQLITSSLSYGETLRRTLEQERAAGVAAAAGGIPALVMTSNTGLPSLNLRGGVWEVRNIFEADVRVPGAEAAASGGMVFDGSTVTAASSAFSDADGPLIAVLASDEAAYAPTMTTLSPHRSYCWLYAACGGGASVRTPRTPSLSAPHQSGYDRDAEVSPAAMQWLFASSILRLQAMLRLKETGLASFVIKAQEVEAAGGYRELLLKRSPGEGEPWVSPGEMLKDEEVQAGVRHNLVYSLLRGVVKRTFKALLSARRAAGDAGEDGPEGEVSTAQMMGVVRECAELLEGALRVVVTHLRLQEGPADPHPTAGRRGPPILIADPLPPLHGAMHGVAAAAPRPSNRPVDPHASWYGVDPEVGAVIIRSALFLAVKDVVAQAAGGAAQEGKDPRSPVAGPGPADVSDEDATLSALVVKGLVRVARGQVTGSLASAYAERARASADAATSTDPLSDVVGKELAVMALARRLVWRNHLGPIIFVTPELGKWSTVGGLGVMVDELSVGLAELGAEVICISPYYHLNRKGVADYLAADGVVYTSRNVVVWVGGERVEMGVHEGVVNGVRVLFLHNPLIFPKPYPAYDAYQQTRVMSAFAKGTLELLCQWRLIPGLVVTNDWFTGLLAAYARNPKFFGAVFNRTDFLHIAHNLNPDYEGRMWPDRAQGSLTHLHELDSHLLVDPFWQDVVINPTRAALLCSDSWATVSRSYRGELLAGSPLRALLRLGPHPFAHPNGIPVKARQARLGSLRTKTHDDAKAALQKKFFGLDSPDLSIPMFAFVGRITLQKGVHLILESVDALLTHAHGRAHFLVGGMASESDSYGRHCASMMAALRVRHPSLFWADPGMFFTDGDFVNLGADFCMMPSVFEPGGIVQQEFFVAGTPVIAFKTGGLKDTVLEWNARAVTGNGFVFEAHAASEFQAACRRALGVYHDPAQYAQLRANARASVMDLSIVCQAWYREFHRLRRCLPPPPRKPVTSVPVRFQLKLNEVPGASAEVKVFVAGSFNGWNAQPGKRLDLQLNKERAMFEGVVSLPPGVYTYKFVLDMAHGGGQGAPPPVWCTTPDAPLADDGTGNMNNVVHVLAPPTLPDDE